MFLSLTKNIETAAVSSGVVETQEYPMVVKAKLMPKGKVKVTFRSPVKREDVKKENFHIDGVFIVKSFLWMDMQNLELRLSGPLMPDKEYKLKFAPSGPDDVVRTQEIVIEK